jgi:hypothetical protein
MNVSSEQRICVADIEAKATFGSSEKRFCGHPFVCSSLGVEPFLQILFVVSLQHKHEHEHADVPQRVHIHVLDWNNDENIHRCMSDQKYD